jgi:phage terminase large subunit GpA-like protein
VNYDPAELDRVVAAAQEAWRPREPLTLLRPQSTSGCRPEVDDTEGPWRCWPFQRAILLAIGDDRIEQVMFKKSARLGWTAMLRAATGTSRTTSGAIRRSGSRPTTTATSS